jgi:hypothetical protein
MAINCIWDYGFCLGERECERQKTEIKENNKKRLKNNI